MLTIKPIQISRKKLKKLHVGVLIDGFEPYNLRIISEGSVIARAKLGQIDGQEAIYIVDAAPTSSVYTQSSNKKIILEARIMHIEQNDFKQGEIITCTRPISTKILIVADSRPIAIGSIVDYDSEPYLYISRMLDAPR